MTQNKGKAGYFSRLIMVVVSVTLVVSALFSLPTNVQANEDPYRYVLRIGTMDSVLNDTTDPKTDYFTGEQIPASLRFEASGTLVNIVRPTLRLTIPKIAPVDPNNPKTADIYLEKPQISSSGQAIAERRGEDATSWWIEYDYEVLRGGTTLEYPFPFRFNNYKTPNGTTVTPVATLYDQNGQVLLEKAVTFTAKASYEYTPKKIAWVFPWFYGDDSGETLPGDTEKYFRFVAQDVYDERVDYENAKSALSKTRPTDKIEHLICANSKPLPEAKAGMGEYSPKTITFTDYLPPEAEYRPLANRQDVWTYDPQTHTVTATVDYDRTYSLSGSTGCLRLMVHYPEVPVSEPGAQMECNRENTVCSSGAPRKVYVNRAKIVLDKGTAQEQELPMVKWDHFFVREVRFRPFGSTHAITFEKEVSAHERVNRPYSYWEGGIYDKSTLLDPSAPETEHFIGLQYHIKFNNVNNGQRRVTDGEVPFGGTLAYVSKMVDKELDPRLYFKTIRFNLSPISWRNQTNTPASQLQAHFAEAQPYLVGVKADGSEEIITENVSIGKNETANVYVNDTEGKYRGWELRFRKPHLVIDNMSLTAQVWVYPTAEELATWASGAYKEPQRYYNGAQVFYQLGRTPHTKSVTAEGREEWVPGTLKLQAETQTKYDYNELNNYVQISGVNPQITHSSSSNYTIPYENCERNLGAGVQITAHNCGRYKAFVINTHNHGGNAGNWANSNAVAKNLRQIVLLPLGIEYRYTETVDRPKPKVVNNYQNTGRTAVIYEYGDVRFQEIKDRKLETRLVLDTTLYANAGLNEIDFYTTWDNNNPDGVMPHDNNIASVDTLDLDGDGDKAEKFLHTLQTVNFIPPAEVKVRKLISIDGQNWMMQAPAQDLGGDIYYKLSIINGDRIPLDRVYALDVLPDLQDHTIVDGLLPDGSTGYTPRWWEKIDPATGEVTKVEHSGYVTPLVQAIEDVPANQAMNEKFTYRYSVTAQGADLESVQNARWYTKEEFIAEFGDTSTAWAKVKSVHIALRSGKQLDAGEQVDVVLKAKIPFTDATKALSNGTKAANSVAISRNDQSYLEGNVVRSEIIKYSAEGIVFFDANRNSRADVNEKRLAGYTVKLVNADTGEVATDPNGKELVTTTDTQGHYYFDVYKRGNYKAQFTIKTADEFTEFNSDALNNLQDESLKRVDVHTQPVGRVSKTADTDVFTLNPNNLHEIRNSGIIVGSVPLSILKIDEFCTPVGEVEFELKWKQALPNQIVPTPLPATQIVTTNEDGLIQLPEVTVGVYTLTERESAGNQHLVALQQPVTVTVNNAEITHDGLAVSDPAVAKCVARANSVTVSGIAGSSADNPNRVGTTAGATLSTEDVPSARQTLLARANVVLENKWKRGEVTVTKQDAQVAEVKLAGAVFQLLDTQGNPVRDERGAVQYVSGPTDAQGRVTISNVLWGSYQLKEVQAPANYRLSNVLTPVQIQNDAQQVNVVRENTIFKGTVKATKIGKPTGDKLAGVEFSLTPQNVPGAEVMYARTDTNGVVTFTDVRLGSYVLAETKPLSNYQTSPEVKGREVTVSADGQVVELADPFENEIKRGSVGLVKLDGDTQEPLSGVTFQLFAKDKETARQAFFATRKATDTSDLSGDPNWKWQDIPFYTAVSGADGKVEFLNVPYGNYEVRETATRLSHRLVDTVWPVQIEQDKQHVDLGKVLNYVKRSSLKVAKTNAWGESLAGAEFELRQGQKVVARATTDETGSATFADIPYGNYTVVEVSAPTGYRLNSTELAVEVVEHGVLADYTDQPFVNAIQTGSVSLRKISGDTGAPIAGVSFGLFAKDELTARNAINHASLSANDADDAQVAGLTDVNWQERPVYLAQSDEQGQVVLPEVVYGDYELRELITQEAYVLSQEVIPVSITAHAQQIDLGEYQNFWKRGDITLRKVSDMGAPLKGAVFELRQDGKAVAEATSNLLGVVTFSHVPYGEYEVVEVKAPAGYVLHSQPVPVTVLEDGVSLDLGEVVNKPVPKLAKTGSRAEILCGLAWIALVAGALVWALAKRRIS